MLLAQELGELRFGHMMCMGGPHREECNSTPVMHGPEQSDTNIVPKKPANKAPRRAAERVEGRAVTKGGVIALFPAQTGLLSVLPIKSNAYQKTLPCCTAQAPMPTSWMQVHEQKVVAILYCHNSLISLVGLDCQRKLLMRTDVKRREIWEWSDHTHQGEQAARHTYRTQSRARVSRTSTPVRPASRWATLGGPR